MPTVSSTVYDPTVFHDIDTIISQCNLDTESFQEYMMWSELQDIKNVCDHGDYLTESMKTRIASYTTRGHRYNDHPEIMQYLVAKITELYSTKKTFTKDVPEITQEESQLVDDLALYATAVRTSRRLLSHGKSWEPCISLRYRDGVPQHVFLGSYQFSDKQDFTGDPGSIYRGVHRYVKECYEELSRSAIHSVHHPDNGWLAEEFSEDLITSILDSVTGDPDDFRSLLVQDNVFLLVAYSVGVKSDVEYESSDYSPFTVILPSGGMPELADYLAVPRAVAGS